MKGVWNLEKWHLNRNLETHLLRQRIVCFLRLLLKRLWVLNYFGFVLVPWYFWSFPINTFLEEHKALGILRYLRRSIASRIDSLTRYLEVCVWESPGAYSRFSCFLTLQFDYFLPSFLSLNTFLALKLDNCQIGVISARTHW